MLMTPRNLKSTSLVFLFFSIFMTACSNDSTQNKSEDAVIENAVVTDTTEKLTEPSFREGELIIDGFYLILNESYDTNFTATEAGTVIGFDHKFLDDNTNEQPFRLEVLTDEFVPLTLERKPEGIEQEDKRINLMLSMTDSASVKLEAFTEKYVNRKTCIVVGGKAVTMHKIREKIVGGRLQITRCTDNACQYLLLELEDNVVDQ